METSERRAADAGSIHRRFGYGAMKLFPLALLVALSGVSERAAGAELSLSPALTSISGTLDPLDVSIEGKRVLESNQSFSGMKLNGESVPLREDQSRPFFVQTAADSVELTSLDSDGASGPTKRVTMPRVLSARPAGKAKDGSYAVALELSSDVKELWIDQSPVSIDGSSAKVLLSKPEGGPASSHHAVEIRSQEGFTRLYNLKWDAGVDPPSEGLSRLELGFRVAPGLSDPLALRIGYGWLAGSRFAAGFHAGYLSGSSLHTGALGGQIGYQILQRSPVTRDAPWLEAGWLIQGRLSYSSLTQSGGGSGDEDDDEKSSFFERLSGAVRTGPYVRAVLLNAGAFSIGGRAEFLFVESSSLSGWGELNLHW